MCLPVFFLWSISDRNHTPEKTSKKIPFKNNHNSIKTPKIKNKYNHSC
ncbi:hypothetical protein XBP1_1640005 [Xenorhabdus bovienii str. puntauvense]|uniref:Uncharacterized protein n=1 Tax=Xenorhabdus bovienii str. puntauvense TaxID=1398201 RepID=A0A077NA18_XENBV|nr:hypothetical protein XBP1_1640005 [Xenorhabdus bovienii str. puntauvense]